MVQQEALEYDIFVPLMEASGQAYQANITEGIKADLINFFGGITDTHYAQEGCWKVGSMVVRDEIVIWRVLSEQGAAGDQFIQSIKKRLEETLQQDLILVIRRRVEIFS